MQLSKAAKDAMVRRIMADIPMVDYTAEAQSLLVSKARELMPPEIRAIYDNEELRPFLATARVHAGGYLNSHNLNLCWERLSPYDQTLYPFAGSYDEKNQKRTKALMDAIRPKMRELKTKAEEQSKARASMQEKLTAAFKGLRTLAQAKVLLEPELHKYLPSPPPKTDADIKASTALVPYVVSNLREMGWPKDQEPATEETV